MVAGVSTPYSTISKFFQGSSPSWVPAEDAERFQAYKAYEDIYWGNPDAFKIVMRGTDGEDKPVYVPSGRQIIETLNRYVGKDFGFAVDPTMGTPEQQYNCIAMFQALFDRERLLSKFAAAKRFGLIRGDWGFHITANPLKEQFSRLTITPIDPGTLFKITDPDNIDRVIGYRIASHVTEGEDVYIECTEYLKSEARGEEPGGLISHQTMKLEEENWTDPAQRKVLEDVIPLTMFPPDITALPVYHIMNFEEPGWLYGSSEMRGLEVLATAINQAISDEDVALAMQGLGMYWTDSGAPVDENNEPTDWVLGPGRVVEVGAQRTFNRANGVNTVGPFQDHLSYLHTQLETASSVPGIAMGRVDVSVAESGIALAMRMGPMVDKAEEKDLIIQDILNHMLHDLRVWFKVYEQTDLTACTVRASFGDKVPVNRKERMEELKGLFENGIISSDYYRKVLTEEFGFQFPQNMANEIQLDRARSDPYGERLELEAGSHDSWGGTEASAGGDVTDGE